METAGRIGIIDIGSNSIRLVIYDISSSGAYRIIGESKETARLSDRIDDEGVLSAEGIEDAVQVLLRFKRLCAVQGAARIRAAATAALRRAVNARAVAAALQERTGLTIEVLSGVQEARLGFLGVINTIDIRDGFLIDIGGGSTEVSLFRKRELIHTASFPFGGVDVMRRFGKNGELDDAGMKAIRSMVESALESEPWILKNPGLPLVGLGGAARSLCKIDQRRKKYSLSLAHNYMMSSSDTESVLQWLRSVPFEQRQKIEGLSKERADIILPGLCILHTVFRRAAASHYLISGAGLRDGLFYELLRPDRPQIDNVLEHSVRNYLGLHPSVSVSHVSHVNTLALKLFDDLRHYHGFGDRAHTYLHTASLLYRIGISIQYYNYHKHTYYLLANSRLSGLSHRELLLCALIASFRSEKRTKSLLAAHRDLLSETDLPLIVRLGSLLQLAVALDRSETQPVAGVSAQVFGKTLNLLVTHNSAWEIERRELMSISKDFVKMWGLKLQVEENEVR
jgi:exopolyphosphatase / guanosine-5'-triphosphate,3'-diphosphate pyrophosphatase